ncbi:hypothetical protein Tco_0961858, partial [Tanacetum coccineum]
SQDPNFDQFADVDSILPPVNNRQEDKYKDDTDSQYSDYLVYEDNNVDDVDVDVEEFECNIDETA